MPELPSGLQWHQSGQFGLFLHQISQGPVFVVHDCVSDRRLIFCHNVARYVTYVGYKVGWLVGPLVTSHGNNLALFFVTRAKQNAVRAREMKLHGKTTCRQPQDL